MKYEIVSTRTNEVLMTVEADGVVESDRTMEGGTTPCQEFVNNAWAVGLLIFEKSPDYEIRPKP